MKFLRNTWYVALWAQDLAPGKLVPRTFLNEPIVLFREADGCPAAIADVCAHRFSPLSKGKLVHGSHVRCPYHGLEFDARGQCVGNPHGNGRIPTNMRCAAIRCMRSTRCSGSGWVIAQPNRR